jgi:hypothetical protein
MITFRKKSTKEDLMAKAIDVLDKSHADYKIISANDADKTSKVNSKALVLISFKETERGTFQLQFQSKEVYRYVQDTLLRDTFSMNITDVDKKNRIITAETDHEGIALDII